MRILCFFAFIVCCENQEYNSIDTVLFDTTGAITFHTATTISSRFKMRFTRLFFSRRLACSNFQLIFRIKLGLYTGMFLDDLRALV